MLTLGDDGVCPLAHQSPLCHGGPCSFLSGPSWCQLIPSGYLSTCHMPDSGVAGSPPSWTLHSYEGIRQCTDQPVWAGGQGRQVKQDEGVRSDRDGQSSELGGGGASGHPREGSQADRRSEREAVRRSQKAGSGLRGVVLSPGLVTLFLLPECPPTLM